MKYLLTTVFALLLSLPTWAGSEWRVYQGTVKGGSLGFYSDADLTNETDYASAGSTVYIKAISDAIHTGIGAQFTAEKSLSSGAAQSRTRSGIDMPGLVDVSPVEGKPGVYSFEMPDGYNVTVSATFADKPTTNGVKYLDAEGKEQTANGVYTLDGTEYEIGVDGKETWWVVSSNVEYTNRIDFLGDVHLILADGKKMNMTVTDIAAIASNSTIVIYGQALGTGSLDIDITTKDKYYAPSGILANNLIVNGGIININANNATGATFDGIRSYGIYANNNLTINGGKITVSGDVCICANEGMITLGCNKFTDFVNVSNSYKGTVKIAEGQTLFEGENTYSGTLTSEQVKAIRYKKLYPGHFFAKHWQADANHDGTENKPYIISTTAGLDMLAYFVNEGFEYEGTYFQLGADITYAYTTQWNDATSTENNYTPIGDKTKEHDFFFKGYFDGKNHTVSGIRVYSGGKDIYIDNNKGLFAYVSQGSVKNVTLTDARITGYKNVGGIAADTKGTIENCHVSNTVCIHAVVDNCMAHGGIAGYNSVGVVKGCTSSAVLTIADGVNGCISFGGIIGQNEKGSVQNSIAYKANVAATINEYKGINYPASGAIIGYNLLVSDQNGVVNTLSNCYYIDCQVGTATTNIGIGSISIFKGSDYNSDFDIVTGDITDNNGTVGAFTLALSAGISTTTEAAINVSGTNYYAVGTTVTLTGTGNAPEGYAFSGYSVKDAAGNTVTVSENSGVYSFTMPASSAAVSATFSPIVYTITYDLAGGTLAEGTAIPATYTIESEAIALCQPIRTGYTFAGWTGSNGDVAQLDVTIAKGATGNKTYTANWIKDAVTQQEGAVQENGETFYQPTEEVKEAIHNHIETDMGMSEEAAQCATVNAEGGLNFAQGHDVHVLLEHLYKGEVLVFQFTGHIAVDATKVRAVSAEARTRATTRTDGLLELVSGQAYEVLAEGNLELTIELVDAPATLSSIHAEAASTTGIETVESGQLTVDRWYDMNGRSLQGKPTKKGLYIHNGVKVLVGDKR